MTGTSPVYWGSCKTHSKKKGGLRLHLTQAFFLHVYPHRETYMPGPDHAMDYNYQFEHVVREGEDEPITEVYPVGGGNAGLMATLMGSTSSSQTKAHTKAKAMRIMIAVRMDQTWNFVSFRCMTVEATKVGAAVVMVDCQAPSSPSSPTASYTLQEFLPVQGIMEGAHPLTTVGTIRLAADPSLCVGRTKRLTAKEMGIQTDQLFFKPPSGKLSLLRCNVPDRLSLVRFEFEFMTSY